MNHTKNIIGFFETISTDKRLNPSHISMYVSLFQFWSQNSFQNPFRIERIEIMRTSKIRSVATYHKCIKELHLSGYIVYSPSYDPYRGSLVEISDFREKKDFRRESFHKKLSVSSSTLFSAPKFNEVELYFNERDLTSAKADEFYSFYESQDWKLYNKRPMTSWQAAARNWISKGKRIGA